VRSFVSRSSVSIVLAGRGPTASKPPSSSVSVTLTGAFVPSGAVSVQRNLAPFLTSWPSGQSTEISSGLAPF
jgi:hypothetical protein